MGGLKVGFNWIKSCFYNHLALIITFIKKALRHVVKIKYLCHKSIQF